MFLAGKVEETPRPLKDVIMVSYEIINKKDPTAAQKIRRKEVYERQKELILLGERVVLATLAFDLNVHHPYKPLVEAIKKFKVAQNALAQVALNFVNDGLRTSLCLQFKPHYIAAEVSNQMLELYKQNRLPPSGEADGSVGGGPSNQPQQKLLLTAKNMPLRTIMHLVQVTSHRVAQPSRATQNHGIESSNIAFRSPSNHKTGSESTVRQETEPSGFHGKGKAQNSLKHQSEGLVEQDHGNDMRDTMELKDKHVIRNIDFREDTPGESQDAIKIDKDKVKAALEKQRKSLGSMTQKKELMDEDDLIEREVEAGVEMAAASENRGKIGISHRINRNMRIRIKTNIERTTETTILNERGSRHMI